MGLFFFDDEINLSWIIIEPFLGLFIFAFKEKFSIALGLSSKIAKITSEIDHIVFIGYFNLSIYIFF